MYSLGVLLWEMAAGQRLWAGMSWPQAMAAATLKHARPRTPRHRCTPVALESLARLCMAIDPINRPSFEEVCAPLLHDTLILLDEGRVTCRQSHM